jgi:kynureninase
MNYQHTLAFAKKMDRTDPLRSFRSHFHIPKLHGKQSIYFTGNSLGLQPKSTRKFVQNELSDWAALGVEGHLQAANPWMRYHKLSQKVLASIVGAKTSEVIAMNQLTVNLHLMMVSFYQPTNQRFKILTEAGAFSSDQYAFESHLKFHGLNPEKALIELKPRTSEFHLRTTDILKAIDEHSTELALVIFGGVQYYSGQFFNIPEITKAGHRAGARVGFDLAHAIGNVPLHLHKDDLDFAVWCSYKYLNAGPGGIAGAFVHERHANNKDLPRFAGWWGHREDERFQMKKGFEPIAGAAGWQVSNFPVLSGAALLASLEIFQAAGIGALDRKRKLLTGYLEFLLAGLSSDQFQVITPSGSSERGCQLSILMKNNGRKVFKAITKKGVIADWREPDVIRVAPVPLYNTFTEVFQFVDIFKNAL